MRVTVSELGTGVGRRLKTIRCSWCGPVFLQEADSQWKLMKRGLRLRGIGMLANDVGRRSTERTEVSSRLTCAFKKKFPCSLWRRSFKTYSHIHQTSSIAFKLAIEKKLGTEVWLGLFVIGSWFPEECFQFLAYPFICTSTMAIQRIWSSFFEPVLRFRMNLRLDYINHFSMFLHLCRKRLPQLRNSYFLRWSFQHVIHRQ